MRELYEDCAVLLVAFAAGAVFGAALGVMLKFAARQLEVLP